MSVCLVRYLCWNIFTVLCLWTESRTTNITVVGRGINPRLPINKATGLTATGVQQKAHPWMVFIAKIEISKTKDRAGYCSGSVIKQGAILTAAHCLCWFQDRAQGNQEIPCESNKDGPKSLRDYTDQQRIIESKKQELEIFYLVGETEFPIGDKSTFQAPNFKYHKIFEQHQKARRALKAIVMDTQKEGNNKVILGNGYDIGLIQMQLWDICKDLKVGTNTIKMPDGYIFKGKHFLKKFGKEELDGTTVTYGGYGLKFQWGNRKDSSSNEVQGTLDPKNNYQDTSTTYSTCMTTEEGPVDTRFKYCDIKWLLSNRLWKVLGCHHEDPLTHSLSGTWPENDCKKVWEQLPGIVDDDTDVRSIHRVMVDDQYCYNPKLYIEKGWCRLADDPDKWGFCSESCVPKHILTSADISLPESSAHIRQFGQAEMNVYDPSQHARRTYPILNKCPNTYDVQLGNEAQICLLYNFPSTKTYKFTRTGNDFQLNKNYEEVTEPPKNTGIGYSNPCTGDSGGPVWKMVNNKPEIIGVLSYLVGSGDWDKPSCTEDFSVAVKFSDDIFNWINKLTDEMHDESLKKYKPNTNINTSN